MDHKLKKLYSPGYNLLFDIIAILKWGILISVDQFVDACGISHWVLLYDGVLLRDSLLVLVYPA